jgi:hypothetical protein
MAVSLPQPKANPFVGMERVFAADADPERFDFTIGNLPCFVEIIPLNGSGHNRFQTRVLGVMAELQKLSGGQGTISENLIDDLEVGMLLDCVQNFQLATRTPVKDPAPGDPKHVWQHTPFGKDLAPEQRRSYFKQLSKEFRQALANACAHASGLDEWNPLGAGSAGDPKSANASTGSPPNTGGSVPLLPGSSPAANSSGATG